MKKLLFFLIAVSLLAFVLPVSATVIWSDDFTDGDYTNNPVWAPYVGSWVVLNNSLVPVTASNSIKSSFGSLQMANRIYNLSWDQVQTAIDNNLTDVELVDSTYNNFIEFTQCPPGACSGVLFTGGGVQLQTVYTDINIVMPVFNNGVVHHYVLHYNGNTGYISVSVDGINIINDTVPGIITQQNFSQIDVVGKTVDYPNLYFDNFSLVVDDPVISCPIGWCYLTGISSKTLLELDAAVSDDTIQGRYNSTSKQYQNHRTGYSFNENVTVSPKEGYYYYFTTPKTITPTPGSTPSIILKQGWNLVGNYGSSARTLAELKLSIGATATKASYYDKTLKKWIDADNRAVPAMESFMAYVISETVWVN